MSRASGSMPAANAGVSIARRCGRKSSMPRSGPWISLGPERSIREIAEEAGTAKPKIYRHFTDKSDLFQAIGQRWATCVGGNLPFDQRGDGFEREIIGRGVSTTSVWSTTPERRAVSAPGQVRRAVPSRDGDGQQGPRRHPRDRRHVQQRAREMALDPAASNGRGHDFGLRRRRPMVAGHRSDTPRRMPPTSSSTICRRSWSAPSRPRRTARRGGRRRSADPHGGAPAAARGLTKFQTPRTNASTGRPHPRRLSSRRGALVIRPSETPDATSNSPPQPLRRFSWRR